MTKIVTSLQNPLIKNILLLQEKPRERKNQGVFLIEGYPEIRLSVISGFEINTLLFCPALIKQSELDDLTKNVNPTEMIECSAEVFNRVAYRKDTGGVITIAIQKRISFEALHLKENPLLLVLESVEKPGNLGAVLRTADAAGLDAVIICDPQTDIYNPNTIRSSIGCIFTVPVVTSTSSETLAWLRSKHILAYGTALTAQRFYNETELHTPCAIIMGTEATGLSKVWLEGADDLIKIPMRGRIDSMNVSVSAAIVVFEALRQRNFR
ncbi:MAG: RNA methyltransferase [bacterium]